MTQPNCAHCSAPITRRGKTGPLPKYCTIECRRAAYDARCRADGRHEQRLSRKQAAYEPTTYTKSCAHCAQPFTARRSDNRYCSIRCRNAGNPRRCSQPGCNRAHRAKGLCNRHYNDAWYPDQQYEFPDDPDAKRKRDLVKSKRRRAATRGVRAEHVDRDRVGERDGWRCGICCKTVDRTLTYPHRMSPSLDHVVPLSEGGEHTYANTRIAHLSCNIARRNLGGNEQLALIG